MDEAIDLVLEERSPYPERASFIDDDGSPYVDREIKRALEEGSAAVLVDAEGNTRILHPDTAADKAAPAPK